METGPICKVHGNFYAVDCIDCERELTWIHARWIHEIPMDDSRQQLYGRGASSAGSEDPFPDVQLLRARVPVDAPPPMGDQDATPSQKAKLQWHCWKAYRGY